jgi:hypothetical protein
LAWKNLCDEYERSTSLKREILIIQFNKCRLLDSRTDLSAWLGELRHLHVRLRARELDSMESFDEKVIITQILKGLPQEYDELKSLIQCLMRVTHDSPLSLCKVESEVRRLYKEKLKDVPNVCNVCGRNGHTGLQYRQRKELCNCMLSLWWNRTQGERLSA